MISLSTKLSRFQSTRPVRGATQDIRAAANEHQEFQSTRPVRGATNGVHRVVAAHRNFNPRAPCGARLPVEPVKEVKAYFNPRAPCGARPALQSWLPSNHAISIHAPRAGRDSDHQTDNKTMLRISIHAPRAGRDPGYDFLTVIGFNFNPRAPCGARLPIYPQSPHYRDFNPRAPCGARPLRQRQRPGRVYFNPRAPCGARPPYLGVGFIIKKFQSTRPVRGATEFQRPWHFLDAISIHAPRAGRDSKSIQNYFTHFCDKRQFLDNFTQNAAF